MKKFLLIILLGAAADLLHKYLMIYMLEIRYGDVWPVLPFFNFVMVWNPGISFGLFASGNPWPLIIMNSIIVSGLFYWLYFRTPNRLACWGISLVIGGALGNIIDRIWHGAVADFFDFYIGNWHYPAFNIADSLVFIGAMVLIIDSFIGRKQA